MKRFTFLAALLALLGLSVACNDMQKEEAPMDEAGEEIKDFGDDVSDEAEDAVD